MKILKTQLTEEQFRERMSRLCRPVERRMECEAFVFRQEEKKERFWLGVHHGAKSKHPGLAEDRIDGRLHRDPDGLVTVSYRFGRHPALFCVYLAAVLWGMALAVTVVMEWIGGQGDGGKHSLLALFLLVLGTVGLWGKASERRALESHLRYVCGLDTPTEERTAETGDDGLLAGAPNGAPHGEAPQMADVSEVYPLRMIYDGQEYLTLYGYPQDGDVAELLHGGGRLWRFRDSAQMLRFCEGRGLSLEETEELLRFDAPVTEGTPPTQILNRWNRLSLMAAALRQPFEGDEECHGPLYEILLARSLPMSEEGDTSLSEEQVEEVRQVFAEQDSLFAGFVLWRE